MFRQQERVPTRYVCTDDAATLNSAPCIKLQSTDESFSHPLQFTFEAVSPSVFRTTFTSAIHPLPPFPSARRPEDSLPKGSIKVSSADADGFTKSINTGNVKAVVQWSNAPVVSLFLDGQQKALHSDLPFRSYAVDDCGIAHYSIYKKGTLHVGLGEKAGPMDLSGRGFLITASDTFGYDAYKTDPLYKHIPLVINVTPQGCVGIFSTSHARGSYQLGSEIDGLWGHYKVYRQAYGGLEEYLIVGKTVEEVVRSYAGIVGFPLLVPRYMMGYISGGMKYSMEDEPRAADAILGFINNCQKYDIPVSAFQMSSGYTVAEVEPKTRNVFTWNRHRFPDPRAFTKECHRRGVRLLANVKPYVLANHPAYDKLAEAGAFFNDPSTKKSGVARLWSAGGGESGEGSHIDFTSKAGYDWWFQGCRALKDVGIDAMWNDNNEYNILSDAWECALETVSVPPGVDSKAIGLWGRAMHTELMGKSSHDACFDAVPDERPLVLTRSATAGTMRYACSSWSGDNVTSWEGMKGGNALALNAGFSLLQTYGHDIGGFEGPQPTPEHLTRWIQLGIHSPRFTINCFKTSQHDNLVGEVIEPWMFPSATPAIREAIKRRYELIPYTYSQMLKSHLTAVPPQRWTGWGYESDPVVWTREITSSDTQYWFGDALLIAGVYEPGKTSAAVYLPRKNAAHDEDGGDPDAGFLNVNTPYQHLESGRWHDITSTWHTSIPVLARCGSAVPVGKNRPTTCVADNKPEEEEFPGLEKDDWRGIEIYPPPVSSLADGPSVTFSSTWLEDDGISCEAKADLFEVTVSYTVGDQAAAAIAVEVVGNKKGSWQPLWLPNGVDIILPVGEEREVKTSATTKAEDKGWDRRGRRIWRVSVTL